MLIEKEQMEIHFFIFLVQSQRECGKVQGFLCAAPTCTAPPPHSSTPLLSPPPHSSTPLLSPPPHQVCRSSGAWGQSLQ